jgi:ABC-type nitrate/sulfonate/bicarbonate transport system substrate-binding protein
MMRKGLSRLLLVISVAGLPLSGCSTAAPAARTPEIPVTHVDIALDWVHNRDFASVYIAQDNGFYVENHLDVGVIPFTETSSLDLVAQGKAAFGISNAGTLLQARAQGMPLVAIATIFQRNPGAFASLAERQITRPEDLVGKRVLLYMAGTAPGALIALRAMLKTQGIDPDSVTVVPRVTDVDFTNAPLIEGKVDAMDVFMHNEPVKLARQGHPVNVILSADYGLEWYVGTIFTTEAMIRDHPEVVRAFTTATIRGLQAVIDDPKAAIAHVLKRDPTLDPVIEEESLQRSLPLIHPAGRAPGAMTFEAWQITYQMFRDEGVLTQTLDITQAYTLTFLPPPK